MPGGNSDGFEWKGYMGQLWWNIEYIYGHTSFSNIVKFRNSTVKLIV
jgi:hypothetical protein